MTDIGYQRVDDFSGAPPPSYDAAVSSPQPSAPPPGQVGPPTQFQRAPDYIPPQPVTRPRDRHSASQGGSSKLDQFLQFYVGYSMAHHLRKYMVPKQNRLDPELDVEAKFSRQVVREAQSRIEQGTRLQCITGWLWCFGVIQIFLYILLPIGMLVAGISGAVHGDCPHNSNALLVYLLVGGSLVTFFILARSVPSLMTCFRNRNYLNIRESIPFTSCICFLEVVFYLLAAANLIVLILGTIWIFQDTDVPDCTAIVTVNCCKTYVFVTSAFFNIFQYVMYAITFLYVCLVACCVRNMDRVYGSRE